MTAFDNHLKNKKMPVTNNTTQELITIIEQGFLSAPQAEALNEIKARIIASGDDDDVILSGDVYMTRGGVRPEHAPLIP